MSKKIEMWETDDDKVWATEEKAAKHEISLDTLEYFEEIYYRGMLECAEDILQLLDDHRGQIETYYGLS